MRVGVVALAFGLSLFTLSASPAKADEPSYVEEAVQGLQTGGIYVAPASGAVSDGTLDSLADTVEAENIGIAVLPAQAADETGGSVTEFVRQVATQTDYDTVVVVIGSDLEAASRVLPSGVAAQLANEAERSNPSTDDALTDFVNSVASQNHSSTPDLASGEEGGTPVLPIIGIVLLVSAAAAAAFRFYQKRTSNVRTKTDEMQALPDKLTPLHGEIRDLAANIDDEELKQTVLKSLVTTGRLFWRLREKRSNRIHELTSAYEEHLKNVRDVIEFYLDVKRFPEDHTSPDEAINDTMSSIRGYSVGVQQNMKEVTSDAYTTFRVNTYMLESTVRDETPILKPREEEHHDHHDR